MCVAAPVAMLIISAVSAATTVYAQQQNMKAQGQYNEAQYEGQMNAYRGNLANIEVTRNQMQSDAAQKINENNAASRAAQATARVSAGEAGVAGLSVEALLRDLAGEAGYDNTNVEENYLRQNVALNVKRENAFNETSSSINSLRTPQAPDYIGAGLRIASAGADYYNSTRTPAVQTRGGR